MADTQTDWLMQVRWYTRAEVLAKPSPIPRAAGVFAWWFHGLPNAPTTGCIEAKADEPIGEKIGQYWRRMKGREKSTLAPERIEALLKTVFGADASPSKRPWCRAERNSMPPLNEAIAAEFQALAERLDRENQLLSRTRLDACYAAFRQRFGPDVLADLDGEALLMTMHERGNDRALATMCVGVGQGSALALAKA